VSLICSVWLADNPYRPNKVKTKVSAAFKYLGSTRARSSGSAEINPTSWEILRFISSGKETFYTFSQRTLVSEGGVIIVKLSVKAS
jgi:hypothetical protein